MPLLEPNKPLPQHPTYGDDGKARKFWRLSFHMGRRYVHGLDALGKNTVPTHEREREGYERRLQLTKPQNHAGPIIRRYNDHVFRIDAQREVEDSDPTYQMLVADADGRGVSLVEFMKRSLLRAQIDRECYLMPDTTAPADGGTLSVAQAQVLGVRPFIRRISADAVPWWRDTDGQMVECIVLLEREDGTPYGIHYDASSAREIAFKLGDDGKPDKQFTIASIGAAQAHPYKACPLVRLRPLFTEFDADEGGESQIAPLAEQQQLMANLISLRTEEQFNQIYTQMVLIGASASQVGDQFVGNNRLLCLPNPQGSIERLGADAAASDSIASHLNDTRAELYRIAGVDPGGSSAAGSSAAPESGIARAFKHNDLSANLAALAMACEFAENQIVARIFAAVGKKAPKPVRYPRDFDIPQLSDDIGDIQRGLLIADLPRLLRRKIVERFATRNFPLTGEEKQELTDELDEQDAKAAQATSDPPATRAFGA